MIFFYIFAFIVFFPLFDWNPQFTAIGYISIPVLHYCLKKHLQNIRDNAAKEIVLKRYANFPSDEENNFNENLTEYGFNNSFSNKFAIQKFSGLVSNKFEFSYQVKKHPFFCENCQNLTWHNRFGKKGRNQGCSHCHYFKNNYITNKTR